MKPVCGAASECSLSQVITWLCAWHTSSRPRAVQQNASVRANGNSVARFIAEVAGAASIQTWQRSGIQFLGAEGCQPADTRERMRAVRGNASRHQEKAWGVSSCCTTTPVSSVVPCTPCAGSVGPSPYTLSAQCDFHVFGPLKKALKGRDQTKTWRPRWCSGTSSGGDLPADASMGYLSQPPWGLLNGHYFAQNNPQTCFIWTNLKVNSRTSPFSRPVHMHL
jgi:hypothetical protein